MGIGGISIWQLLIVLLIVVLIFGTKKLKNMGGDLGGAIKNFKDSMAEGKEDAQKEADEKIDQLENKLSESTEQASADKKVEDNKSSS